MQLACEVRAAAHGRPGRVHAPAPGRLGAARAARAAARRRRRRCVALVRDGVRPPAQAARGVARARAAGPSRRAVREALGALGLTATRGPSRWRPRTSPASASGWSLDDAAGAREAQPVPVRRRRGGRRAPRDPLAVLPADARATGSTVDRGASGDEVVCPGSGPNLARRALAALRARGWAGAARQGRDREADPGRRRARRRKRGRGGGPAAGAAARSTSSASSPRGWAPTSRRSSTPASRWSAAPARWSSRSPRRATSRSSLIPAATGSGDAPTSTRRPTGWGSAATPPSSRDRRARLRAAASARRLAARLRRAARQRPRAGGASRCGPRSTGRWPRCRGRRGATAGRPARARPRSACSTTCRAPTAARRGAAAPVRGRDRRGAASGADERRR